MSTFKQTTEKLIELAKVLNEFKSETVQIRLLELLFDQKIMQPVAASESVEALDEKLPEAEQPIEVIKEKPVAVVEQKKAKAKAEPQAPKKEKEKLPIKKTAKVEVERPVKKRSTERPGPSVILKQLIDNKFFSDSRNIGDVVDYCKKMFNYDYKSTDLSGTLAKLAKDGSLMRSKNPETNQFEYTLPQQ